MEAAGDIGREASSRDGRRGAARRRQRFDLRCGAPVTAPLQADVLESTAPQGEGRSSSTVGRTPRQLAWRRLKQDKVALAGGAAGGASATRH